MSAAADGNARLRECKNTEFVWVLKRGIKQGSRKLSCPLTRVSVKRASTVDVYHYNPSNIFAPARLV